jgi:lipopolysaccharide/colanic/teichoic acid biosynthesis glycosyltransferase
MIKRIFDLLCSGFGIVVLLPVFIIISLLIKLDSKGSIFFTQNRVGRFGESIKVYKFRTMVLNAENKGLKITIDSDPRITRVGIVLRKYKFDELAQLFNVFNGTMSLVGPRPEVKEYIDLYPQDIKEKVLSVRPGITDLASIKYKDENTLLAQSNNPETTYVEQILPIKQSYYLKYVDEQSLMLDVKIIFLTIYSIFK